MPLGSESATGPGPEIPRRTADRTRLPALDAEIKHLENALNALHSERKLIQDRLDSYIYPVLTLPNEIVSEIFVQYLPPYPMCPPLLGDGSPTKLAQICSHWRQIAHGTPALWRAIALFVSATLFVDASFQLEMMQTWLERSCTLPLSFIMGAEADNHLRDMALTSLLGHRARWEHVMLDLPSDDACRECLEESMPLLLQLDIGYDVKSRLDTLFGSLDVPRLQNVFLDVYKLPPVWCPQGIPWGQLTKLCLSNTHTATALAILHETLNLVHCRLRLHNGVRGLDSRLFHLPRLETLMIEGYSGETELVVEFLHTVCAPTLKRFSIEEELLRQPEPTSSGLPSVLAAVIKSFGCQLERLSILETQTPAEYQAAFPGIYCDYKDEEWGQWDLLYLYRSDA
ncbi:hypothetical protein C8F01DRAFT_6316 [Mycena amicta]|nr:hypothetical protein C8F01DRAFT_6316 [Mycena amicta]